MLVVTNDSINVVFKNILRFSPYDCRLTRIKRLFSDTSLKDTLKESQDLCVNILTTKQEKKNGFQDLFQISKCVFLQVRKKIGKLLVKAAQSFLAWPGVWHYK